MASNRPGLYSWEVGFSSPTSSQNLGSNNSQKWRKLTKNRLNYNKNPKSSLKTHFIVIIWAYPPSMARPLYSRSYGVYMTTG
jgi:hypothetical protein